MKNLNETASLINADEDVINVLPPSILISFVKREIVYGYKVYSTLQPDGYSYTSGFVFHKTCV